MPDFGWTRLAYSLLVLAALAAIIQIGSPDAATRSPEPPGKAAAAVRPVDLTEPDRKTNTPPRKRNTQADLATRREEAPEELSGSAKPEAAAERETGPPIFYRPALPGGARRGKAERVCGDLRGYSSGSRVLFPLSKAYFGSYEDTWGAPRPQGGHEGTDLMVPTGTPEYAITDGTIVPVAGSNENGWNSLGGYAVMVEASYSVGPVRKGDLFYYAHLKRESDLEIGDTVSAGQVLGYAGDTGQGPEVTGGLFPPHLHLGWYDTTGVRSNLDSGAMNPFLLLEWIEANGGALRGGSDARYCEAPRTGTPRPSVGGDRWPAPKDPGLRPDLSARSPAPSPVVRKHTHEREARKHRSDQAGPERPDARPPRDRSGDSVSRTSEPSHDKAPPPDPRAGKDPSPARPESPPADGGDEGRSQPPGPKDRPDQDGPDRPGEKGENQKDRVTRTPPKDDSPKSDPRNDGPDKAPDKERDRGSGSPDEPPEREPPPPAPDASETEDAETTTAEDGTKPDAGDPTPEEPAEESSEEQPAETTTPGG